MFVCCECCVLSGRGLCDGLITRPEESYRLWCVVCDLETSWMRRPWPTGGCHAKNKQTYLILFNVVISGDDNRHTVFLMSLIHIYFYVLKYYLSRNMLVVHVLKPQQCPHHFSLGLNKLLLSFRRY
jgi:hypothetical protein